ncbi:hypothetical protein AMS68_002967 [Peltaster fructicola]|uniref:Probable cytosolic iron-sulfur protein assembly protein 1 n=1 Tax=Peltaster fructicola TaxID=286661 RepID=A0A6H0XSK5_9PEZI|nr:hypothetical protein AMS68_002967 [Peltaster fructicola]
MPSISPLATFSPGVNSRAWSSTPHPRLPIIATACSDKSVRIYSTVNFAQQSSITGGHKRSIRSCAWKPNSIGESVLVTGSFDASAGIWRRWEENAGEGAPPKELDFTTSLAGGDGAQDDEDDEWRFAVILDGHDSEIKSVAFAPSAPLLATCSRDKSIWIWEELEDDNFETVAVLQEHEGDVKCVAWHTGEPLLASASYDDNIRLWKEDDDDWACCTLLAGHEGTVWWVAFEAVEPKDKLHSCTNLAEEQRAYLEERAKAGPRLISCSDDKTIRVWQRVPKDVPQEATGQRLPSIWKNKHFEEEWTEQSRLPSAHERAIYALSWSATTGRVVSCGSDGKIVVYEEQWSTKVRQGEDTAMSGTTPQPDVTQSGLTKWVVIAEYENAHDVFEVNHVVWALRADKARRGDGEEIIISTGDDGEVKAWTLDE